MDSGYARRAAAVLQDGWDGHRTLSAPAECGDSGATGSMVESMPTMPGDRVYLSSLTERPVRRWRTFLSAGIPWCSAAAEMLADFGRDSSVSSLAQAPRDLSTVGQRPAAGRARSSSIES